MNSNTYLKRFGLDPNDFKVVANEPVETDDGFLYLLEQDTSKVPCPLCNSNNVVIKDYYFKEINISSSIHIKDVFKIKMCRFKCKDCKRSFVKRIKGIDAHASIANYNKKLICADFYYIKTFKEIAEIHHCSSATVIEILDTLISRPKRLNMPETLCLDEFYFSSNNDQKYCVLLVDWKTKEIVDIIQNRQIETLREYFSNISNEERKKVKYFVTDLYDGYRTIKKEYFKSAIHIADFYHIVIQLSRPINSLRNQIMRQFDKSSTEYKFMSKYWRLFQCRSKKIPRDKEIKIGNDLTMSIYDYFFKCLKLNDDLLLAYNALQDLFNFSKDLRFTDAQNNFIWLANKLNEASIPLIKKVASTYKKWLIEIGNAYTYHDGYTDISNGIAEGMNNAIKTIIKDAYGYHNFERFRKRALLLLRH